jgi:hypothetical protein
MRKIFAVLFLIFALSMPAVAMAQLGDPQMSDVLAIAQTRVPGYSYVAKFGANPLITTASDPEDIWEGGGMYPDSAETGTGPDVGVADIVSMSSSDADDDQDVLIYCLGADGYVDVQVVALQGQTRVAISPCWDIYRAENFDGTDFEGTVYIYSGTEATDGVPSGASVTKAIIVDGNNQTQMARYRIPLGKVGFLLRGTVSFGYSGTIGAGTQQVQLAIKVKTYGGVYKVKETVYLVSTASNEYKNLRMVPDPLPALTVVKLNVVETTADISAAGTFHLILVDESKFNAAYLASIGQPTF